MSQQCNRGTEAAPATGRGVQWAEGRRDDRIRTVKELADAYLEAYKLRHRAVTFATYALGNVKKHLGDQMAVDATGSDNKGVPVDTPS